MSYWFGLCDPVTDECLSTDQPHQIQGATYAVGGTTELSLNITYNYSVIISKVFNDNGNTNYANALCGKTGAESIPLLKSAIDKLGNDVDDDYWKATEGNAKRALCGLLAFAQLRPDGVWNVF